MKHNDKNNNNILTDRQKAVIETVKMRLTEKESLEYSKTMDLKYQTQHFIERRINQKR